MLATVCLVFLLQDSSAIAADVFGGAEVLCPGANNLGDRKDYRLRDTTHVLRWKAADTYENHLAPALRRMNSGDYSDTVIADLDFLLIRWPNHYPALQALVAFEAGGGRANKFTPVPCYFQRANWFVSDDANVFVLFGNYQRKLGRDELAEKSWMRALAIDENAIEAHYNLGLLYYSLGRHSASVDHARVAYELGYPLPGLKRKLAAAGYWE